MKLGLDKKTFKVIKPISVIFSKSGVYLVDNSGNHEFGAGFRTIR